MFWEKIAPPLIWLDNKVIDWLFQPIINGFQINKPEFIVGALCVLHGAGWIAWMPYMFSQITFMEGVSLGFGLQAITWAIMGSLNLIVLSLGSMFVADRRRRQPNGVRMFGFFFRYPALFMAAGLLYVILTTTPSWGLLATDASFWLWWVALNLLGCEHPGPPLRFFRSVTAT